MTKEEIQSIKQRGTYTYKEQMDALCDLAILGLEARQQEANRCGLCDLDICGAECTCNKFAAGED